jgi:sigma-B regulation protein RsbU (phosphoserine phosphatase)
MGTTAGGVTESCGIGWVDLGTGYVFVCGVSSPESNLQASAVPLSINDVELAAWLREGIDAHAIVAITDAKGVIVFANDRFCEVSGYKREELIGKTHRILKSGEHPDEFYADLWTTIAAGKVWHGLICNRAKGGNLYWVESTLVPLPGADGKPKYYLALRTDVSRLKRAEETNARLVDEVSNWAEELRQTQAQLALFSEQAPIGLSWREIDRDGRPGVNHVNGKFCELIGMTAEEARDIENVRRATHPDDWNVQEKLTEDLYQGRRDRFAMDKRYIHRDGRTVWATLTVVVLRNGHGHVTHHFAMLEDITARRAAEEELRRSESRWRTYLGTASEILYALTPEHRFKFVSEAWTTKLGHATQAVIGREFTEFVHPEDQAICRQFIHAVMEGEPHANLIEYRAQHADGRWVWHASTGSAYIDRDGRHAYFGVGRDISIRRQAQDELKAALARREELERIVNRSPSVVVLWRADGGQWPVEFVSASVKQFGYTPEQFTGRQLLFTDITHPEDRERVLAEVAAHAEAKDPEYNQSYRIVCADGSVRWVDDHTVVRRNAEGQVTHHEGLISDVTDRHQAEEAEKAARERDLRVAADIQQHLRPRVFPDLSEVEIEMFSASTMHIGGDYFDVMKVDERHWAFVIADVSGKGAGAALMMAECRATLRLCASGELSPAAVIRRLNRAIQPDMRPGMFITLFYGILDLDTNALKYVRAGHEDMIVMRKGATAPELLHGEGLAVGLDDGSIFDDMIEEKEVALNPGDVVALYTDGITEARNAAGEEFGRDRLAAALLRNEDKPLSEVVKRVDRFARQFSALVPRHDDSTLLLFRPR